MRWPGSQPGSQSSSCRGGGWHWGFCCALGACVLPKMTALHSLPGCWGCLLSPGSPPLIPCLRAAGNSLPADWTAGPARAGPPGLPAQPGKQGGGGPAPPLGEQPRPQSVVALSRTWLCPPAFTSGCSPVRPAVPACGCACPAVAQSPSGCIHPPRWWLAVALPLQLCRTGLRHAAAIHRRFPRLQPHYLIKWIHSAAGGAD